MKPSEQMLWLAPYGGKSVREKCFQPVEEISVWQYLEKRLLSQEDRYAAFEYFGNRTSRSELIERVHKWSRAFRAMGIGTDDKVVLFAPFTPTVASMLLALNNIGAWTILPNMAASTESLKECCAEAVHFIVCHTIEDKIAPVIRERTDIRNIILTSVFTDMPPVTGFFANLKEGYRYRRMLMKNRAYTNAGKAFGLWKKYNGPLSPEFDKKRPAFITSSGGTSEHGYAKHIIDTNQAVIGMLVQTFNSGLAKDYVEGTLCYTSLPPFVSTSILVLFLAPLLYGMTCLLDPRPTGQVFNHNIMKFKPQITLVPGCCWVNFFTHICNLEKKGIKPDLSFFRFPIIGGEGVSVKDLKWINGILRRCGSPTDMVVGYGMSEVFSLLTVDFHNSSADNNDNPENPYPVISVGYALPGATIGIFDRDGNELDYGQRGEIRVKSTTMMQGYYRNNKLNGKVFSDGWFKSRDIGFLDNRGRLYVLCRMSSGISLPNGEYLYPVDIENQINCDSQVRCSMVNNMAAPDMPPRLAAHVVVMPGCTDTEDLIRRLDETLEPILPHGITIDGYKTYSNTFRMSNVCKTDRNYYLNDKEGYLKFDRQKGTIVTVSFG
ncbi:MAG: acyl--CoA ligase [Bacteroidaceae bacterium]|nr:acyl--CoA ligase [Bacteroidaceae bacterium]